jgi:hypothetical protein
MTQPPKYQSVTRHWPFAVAGFLGPLLSALVGRFLSLPIATGLVMFLLFTAAVVLVEQSAKPARTLGKSMVPGLVAGSAAGIASFALTLALRGW